MPATYASADIGAEWCSLFAAMKLARRVGVPLAGALGEEYIYDFAEDERTVEYLHGLHGQETAA